MIPKFWRGIRRGGREGGGGCRPVVEQSCSNWTLFCEWLVLCSLRYGCISYMSVYD